MTPDRTQRRRRAELTRTQWLTRPVDADDLLAYVGMQDTADVCISVAGTLGRIVTDAGPWNMQFPMARGSARTGSFRRSKRAACTPTITTPCAVSERATCAS